LLVLRGRFHSIEKVLFALCVVFLAYIVAGILAEPDWGAALHGLVVPTMPLKTDALVIATATVGTTLAPWGLAFIQSYAVDKRLTTDDLRFVRIDVITGSVLTGVIGFFVVIACAATLHTTGITISDASDAARALEPLAGAFASQLFGIGLIGAALLAALILPLSTAYSVSEFLGREAALDDDFDESPVFYATFGVIMTVGAALVLIPGAPLVPILVLSQVVNAVLLVPLLAFMVGVARDPALMGEHAIGNRAAAGYLTITALITVCVATMGVLLVS